MQPTTNQLHFHAPSAPNPALAPFPWISLAILLLTIALISLLAWKCLCFWKLHRKKISTIHTPTPYQVALHQLAQPFSSHNQAAQITSHSIRAYLASKWNDPSLYQTHEEFISRHHAIAPISSELRLQLQQLLQLCASVKYAPPASSGGKHFIEQAHNLLERLEHHSSPSA